MIIYICIYIYILIYVTVTTLRHINNTSSLTCRRYEFEFFFISKRVFAKRFGNILRGEIMKIMEFICSSYFNVYFVQTEVNYTVSLHSPTMCEIPCQVVNTPAIYSGVHGYE
jgi:hypothetical protein